MLWPGCHSKMRKPDQRFSDFSKVAVTSRTRTPTGLLTPGVGLFYTVPCSPMCGGKRELRWELVPV